MKEKIGYFLVVVAGLIVVLAVGAVIYDLLVPIVLRGTQVAQEGNKVGAVLGTIIRTVILFVFAVALLVKGLAILRPDRFGKNAILLASLESIIENEKDNIPIEPTNESGFYGNDNEESLIEVYNVFRREHNPERFGELLAEIQKRFSSLTAAK